MTKTRQEIHNNRPTSPHLGIYRKQISSVLSIFHRLSGLFLFGVSSIAAWWFIILVFSGFNEKILKLVTNCVLVKPALMLCSLAAFYHLCTGIRHLIWDTGRCFSVQYINITGWAAVICAFSMTILFWL